MPKPVKPQDDWGSGDLPVADAGPAAVATTTPANADWGSNDAPADTPTQDNKQSKGFLSSVGDQLKQLNPLPALQAGYQALSHPVDTYNAYAKNQGQKISSIADAVKAGQYGKAAGQLVGNTVSAMDPMGIVPSSGEMFGKAYKVLTAPPTQYPPNEKPSMLQTAVEPLERFADASRYALAGAVPLIGPSAMHAGETAQAQAAEGDVPGAFGTGVGNLAVNAAAPEAIGLAGKGLRAIAKPVARIALKIPPAAEVHGADPGSFILDRTSGLTPESVGRQTDQILADTGARRDAVINAAQRPVAIQPTRQIGANTVSEARAGNSIYNPSEEERMVRSLTDVQPGSQLLNKYQKTPMVQKPSAILGPNGQPVMVTVPGTPPTPEIAPYQSVKNAVQMRSDFNKENIANKWDHTRGAEQQPPAVKTAKRMYGQLASDIHKAEPALIPLDKTFQDALPVKNGLRRLSGQEGVEGQLLDQFTRPTGALAGAAIAGHAAGPLGAAATIAGQRALASPSARLGLARAANLGSKTLQFPLVRNLPRLAKPRTDEDDDQ